MFDIGFPELLLVSLIALLVLGPERLPDTLRTLGRWFGQARRSFQNLRDELEREIGADEIRRDLHNARIMEQSRDLQANLRAVSEDMEEALTSARRASLEALEAGRTEAGRAEADNTGADDTGAGADTSDQGTDQPTGEPGADAGDDPDLPARKP